MAINARCPGCGSTYTVADRFAGLKGRCKKCKALFVMPVKSEVDIVLDESVENVVSVETDQAESPSTSGVGNPTTSGPPRPKRKKKKKRAADKRIAISTAWWWGSLAIVAGLCVLALVCMAAFGYRLSARTWALNLIFSVPLNTIIFALSLLIGNYYGSGVQLTEFRILIPKALILILLTSFVSFVPYAGFFFAIGVWFIGVMTFFELELMEAALIVAINFVLGFFARLFLLGMLINSVTVPTVAPSERPPDASSAPSSK
jgi:hypothetical protein